MQSAFTAVCRQANRENICLNSESVEDVIPRAIEEQAYQGAAAGAGVATTRAAYVMSWEDSAPQPAGAELSALARLTQCRPYPQG
jgi:hypothetical protein